MTPHISLIQTDKIKRTDECRKVDPAHAQALAESINQRGLLSPIEVVENDDEYSLVYGAHRLAAVHILGWTDIPAIVKDPAAFASEADIRLRTISENMIRRELSVLDRSVDIATWCEIYRETQTSIKPNKKALNEKSLTVRLNSLNPDDQSLLSAKFSASFSEAAKQTFNLSRASVFFAIKIAGIPADLREKIALHPLANSTRDLLALAAEPAHRQEQIINTILDDSNNAETVGDAIALLDRQPPPARDERWQKVSASFGQLKTSEQYRFFDLHAEAIAKWQAERER